jgi:hypothetical protein
MYTDSKKYFLNLKTIKKYGVGKGISFYQCKSVANLFVLGWALKTQNKNNSVAKQTNYG